MRPPICPICGQRHPLRKHGTYSRGIYDFDLGHVEIEILRYYCPACGRTVSILPDFAAPHKYYSSFVISICLYLLFCCEAGIRDIARRFGLFRSVISYWLRQFHFNRVNLATVLRDYFHIPVPVVELSAYGCSPHITGGSLRAFLSICELVLGGEIESCRGDCDRTLHSCEKRSCSGLIQGVQRYFSKLALSIGIF